MKLGTNDIGSVYLGTNAVSSVYLGTNLVWSGMDADYKAILDYATTQGYTLPSAGQQALQNQLVVDLKDAGIWSKLDLLYVFATDGDRDFAAINWKNPNNHEIIEVNSPTFTTNKGFSGNGSSAYLNTNFNVSTDGSNYVQDDSGVFVAFPILSSTTFSANYAYGTQSSTYLSRRIDLNSASSNNRIWMNSINRVLTTNTFKTDDSIYFANRINSATINFRNTILSTSTTETNNVSNASTSIPNESLYLLGSAFGFFESTANMGIMGLGSQFSTSQMEDIETAWYTNYYLNI